jgi:MYXO-CTERM domain-containing protein
MKKLILTSLCTLIGYVAPASAATVFLTPSTLNPIVGQTFTIDVSVNDTLTGRPGDEVIFFGFDITNTNAAAASLFNVLVGPLFLDDSGSFLGTDVNGTAADPFTPITGDPLLLAILTFTANQAGIVTLGTFSDTGNGNEGLQFLFDALNSDNLTSSLTFTVSEPSSVPEPSPLALGALGLVMIVFARRRVMA